MKQVTYTEAHFEMCVKAGWRRVPGHPAVVNRSGGNLCARCGTYDCPAFLTNDWDRVVGEEWSSLILCLECYLYLKTGDGEDPRATADPESLEFAHAYYHDPRFRALIRAQMDEDDEDFEDEPLPLRDRPDQLLIPSVEAWASDWLVLCDAEF